MGGNESDMTEQLALSFFFSLIDFKSWTIHYPLPSGVQMGKVSMPQELVQGKFSPWVNCTSTLGVRSCMALGFSSCWGSWKELCLLEKAMAPQSSTLAWKIPWTEEPGGLQSMGSRRVGHDWVTSLSLFTFMHWRRKWQPTPVFLPGESQEWGSLVGCRLWGCTESDTTEVT